MEIVADTHALLWYLTADKKLGSKAKQAFKQGEQGKTQIIIPVVVLLETLVIIEKQRIKFSWHQFKQALKNFPRLIIYPLDASLLPSIRKISSVLELHDRIIIATAKIHQAPLITRDHEIIKIKEIKTIWN